MASSVEKQRQSESDDFSFSLDGGERAATTNHDGKDNALTSTSIQYDVEHLATFSTASSHEQAKYDDNGKAANKSKFKQASESSDATEPKVALQKLFELEKLSGIWTQRMQIELQNDVMLILDCETNSIVERFHYNQVTQPEAFNHYNDIYNNIIVFIIDQKGHPSNSSNQENCDKIPGELHIFQCVSHKAKQLVSDILEWKSSMSCEDGKENSGLNLSLFAPALSEANNKSSESPEVAMRPIDGNVMSSAPANVRESSQEFMQDTRISDDQKLVDAKTESALETQNLVTTTRKEDIHQSTTPAPDGVESRRPKPAVIVASSSTSAETIPVVNVNVKETVQVFNQIAALREKR